MTATLKSTLAFLTQLERNNNKAWFEENRPAYETARAAVEDFLEAVIDVLQTCYDPEIPVNIYDLGLIYAVDVSPEQVVSIQMTLTSPACPVAGTLPPEVQQKVAAIPGVRAANVDLVWEPPWGRHLLSEAARLQLGMDGY
jgi:FeS assembly SUF system protein